MKALRTIAFILVLLAQTVIMAHNAIPHHHHHHQKEECHTSCCHSHDADRSLHLCDSEECATCTFLTDPFENHSYSFGQTILVKFTKIRYYLPEDAHLAFGTRLCIGKISKICSGSSGLRAPPTYM